MAVAHRVVDRLTLGTWHDEREQPVRVMIAFAVAALVAVGALFVGPRSGPFALLLAVPGAVAVALILGSPLVGLMLLIVTSFLRQALIGTGLPAEPMVLVLAATFVAVAIAGLRRSTTFRFGALEVAMAVYLLWNIVSMLSPHDLPPTTRTGQPLVVYRFILTGTILPFVGFVVARAALHDERRVMRFLYALVVPATYSAVVSVLQFTGPKELVWPQYIVTAPSYPERAVGVVNHPVVNGMVIVAGFVTALFLAQAPSIGRGRRLLLLTAAAVCLPGIYLTKTRAVWLAFGLGLVLCVLFARGARKGFAAVLLATVALIGINWAVFTSSDRTAGGINSSNEVNDRLNSIATSLWAIEQRPWFGWGIARFAQVNTYYHKVWAPSMQYQRGYGIASHENELGIATELGLVGLALWLAVLALLVAALVRALRRLPREALAGQALRLSALTWLGAWVVAGLTADLRFFDFLNLVTFVLIGAAAGVTDRLGGDRERDDARTSEPDLVGVAR